MKSLFIICCSMLSLLFVSADTDCDTERYILCMDKIHNATVGHEHHLFQNAEDLSINCPILRRNMRCVKKFAESCGTEMLAEDFDEQFDKPSRLIKEICAVDSSLRREYLNHSKCMLDNSEAFEACSESVYEYLSSHEADTEEKVKTIICIKLPYWNFDFKFSTATRTTTRNTLLKFQASATILPDKLWLTQSHLLLLLFSVVSRYETILRGCLMSTAAQTCGLDAANLVRKVLQYAPSHGMDACSENSP